MYIYIYMCVCKWVYPIALIIIHKIVGIIASCWRKTLMVLWHHWSYPIKCIPVMDCLYPTKNVCIFCKSDHMYIIYMHTYIQWIISARNAPHVGVVSIDITIISHEPMNHTPVVLHSLTHKPIVRLPQIGNKSGWFYIPIHSPPVIQHSYGKWPI